VRQWCLRSNFLGLSQEITQLELTQMSNPPRSHPSVSQKETPTLTPEQRKIFEESQAQWDAAAKPYHDAIEASTHVGDTSIRMNTTGPLPDKPASSLPAVPANLKQAMGERLDDETERLMLDYCASGHLCEETDPGGAEWLRAKSALRSRIRALIDDARSDGFTRGYGLGMRDKKRGYFGE
jgi:hypothetical protein